MSWRAAPCLDVLLSEFNRARPHRDKKSDGAKASAQHHQRNPTSDHEVDANGVVKARDYDEDLWGEGDPRGPADMARCAEHIRQLGELGDVRLNGTRNGYIIYEGRIAGAGKGWKWRKYTGPNKHDKHVHVSTCTDPAGYSNRGPWGIYDLLADTEPTEPAPLPGLEYLGADVEMPVVAQWKEAVFLVDYDMATGQCRRRTFPDPSRLGQVMHSQGVTADRSKNPWGDAFPVLNDQFDKVYIDLGPA